MVTECHKFTSTIVTTNFGGKKYKHKLFLRNPLSVIEELVGDPRFKDDIVIHAERVWVSRPDGQGNMRRYEEYNQADDMWDIQVWLAYPID
jgi:hypothetical protein